MADDAILHSPTHADNRVSKSSASGSPAGSGSNLNPRSCVTCRRRKVKCDKKQPCANCVRAHIECIFPSPGRAPRKPRKPQDSELIDRLKRLEGILSGLGVQVADGEAASPAKTADAKEDALKPVESTISQAPSPEQSREERINSACKELKALKAQQAEEQVANRPFKTLESRFGRLVIGDGRSRYINPSFWANLSDEVENLNSMLEDTEDESEDDLPSPDASNSSSNHHGFMFGLSSQNVDMLSLHPPKEHIAKYWDIYKKNVDPLVKIIHVPTMTSKILDAAQHLDDIPKGMEALLFAVYYSATTSLWAEECRTTLGESKEDLLARYRFGVEQGLARADFLQTDEIIVLQAFVIFLICLRRNDDARVIWTLSGLVVRMAQSLGIHRDGSHFKLRPFEIEMRRRLWWQICILDARASEDHGCDPTINDQLFDTKMPLNVNDEDLVPEMPELPESKIGCTEMTFGLIRFEITSTLKKIQFVPPGPEKCNKFLNSVPIQQKEQWIIECHKGLEERYLNQCDMNVPLYWVIAAVSRLIMSKMWLMIYHPFQRQDGGASLPQETKDKLFTTSLENLEYSLLLQTEEKTRRWGWLFRTYVQWHAIAFLLSELRFRTKGDLVDRAWRAVNCVLERKWADDDGNKLKGHLWKPLKKLRNIAKQARDAELKLQRELAMVQLQQQVEFSRMDPVDPIMSVDLGVDRLYPNEMGADFDPNMMADFESNFWSGPNIFSPATEVASLPNAFVTGMGATTAPMDLVDDTPMDPQRMGSITSVSSEWPTNDPANQTRSPVMSNGNVDWESWDNLVEQFGMEVDSGPQGRPGQPLQYNSTFGGVMQWY